MKKMTVNVPGIGWRETSYGEGIKVPRSRLPCGLPPEFHSSPLSLLRGARRVLRDGRERDSLQAREYVDHWQFELDRWNPEASPKGFAAHALTDALAVTVTVCLVGAALAITSRA